MVSDALHEVNELSRLVSDLLLLARLDTEDQPDQSAEVSVLAILADIADLFGVLAEERGIELAVEVVRQRQRQLELATARFEAGSVTKRDVLQTEVELGRARTFLESRLGGGTEEERRAPVIGEPLDHGEQRGQELGR